MKKGTELSDLYIGILLPKDGQRIGPRRPLARYPSDRACSVGWFVSLMVREEVLLTDLYERKILFELKIYDRLR